MSLPALQLLFVKASNLLSRKGSELQTPPRRAEHKLKTCRLYAIQPIPER